MLKEKKKSKQEKLTIVRKDSLPRPLSNTSIEELKQLFEEMAKAEEDVMAVNQLKNDLEAAIYGNREGMESDTIIQISTEQQRTDLVKLCAEYEEWMYEAGSTRSDYETRLQTMRDTIGPMEERALELEARADLPETVNDITEQVRKDATFVAKNMTWVNESKSEAILTKLKEFEDWWAKKIEQQNKLPLHEAPAFTKVEVMEQLTKIQKDLDKLKKIKKPKETKPKAKKNETDTKDKKAKSKKNAPVEDPLPEDVATAEAELEKVRAEKSKAVQDENFDLAQSLKKREKQLVDHVETLKAQKSEL